ncbi:hypothetical protein CVV43_01550, partial [Candidatus Saccharibacteria bacterium HGW-Saccharibacteria-1]
DGTTLDYAYSSGDNSYCLTATKEGRSYYINSEGRVPVQGGCPVGNVGGNLANTFARTWGGSSNDYAFKLIQTNDGGYAVAGDTYSYGAGGSRDAFIAKYTSDGTLSWSRTWGGTSWDYISSLVQTSDGGYVIAGDTVSYGTGFLDNNAYIAKFTADGTLSWSRTWGGTNSDFVNSLVQTSDGGYVVAGSTSTYGMGRLDAFIAKFTADGNLSWSRTWGGVDHDGIESLVQTNDGGYAVAGYTLSYGMGSVDATDKYGANIYGINNGDAFIAKFTADGSLSWNRTWGGANSDQIESLVQTSDGGYAVAGGTSSYGAGSLDAFISKFTADGTLSWSRTWGGANSDDFKSLVQTSDGGYAVAGDTNSYGMGNDDVLIIKFTADGLINNCPSLMCQSPSATSTNLTATVTSPVANITNPSASTASPNATVSSPTVPTTNPIPIPIPPMTITFSSQELYVAYPGESQSTCKEWTAPTGKQIKGFLVSQETESSYDFFIVSLDDTEVYNKSGAYTDEYIDTIFTPGSTLKACMSTDSSVQEGYGGEVTGVVYN